jgi:large subunit ribosomal protein L21
VTYSIIETGSKQYRVSAGDRLEVERLGVQAGQPVTFDRVLLVNNGGKISVGSPTVAEASVVADVVEHIRGEKKLTFKMKRRKGYHKTIGHRQELTVVKIKEIRAPGVSPQGVASTGPSAATTESQPSVGDK